MYKKDFIWRTKEKIHIDQNFVADTFFIKPREVWFIKLWVNIGSETDGKHAFERPVLILKKVWAIFWVLPLTTKWKDNNIFYYKIESIDFGKPSYVILSQIRTIDKRRCMYCIWKISSWELKHIKKSLCSLMA